jgi:hypothetical protein
VNRKLDAVKKLLEAGVPVDEDGHFLAFLEKRFRKVRRTNGTRKVLRFELVIR